jgi:hypothetical protein
MEVFLKLVQDILQNKDGRDPQEFNLILKILLLKQLQKDGAKLEIFKMGLLILRVHKK